MIALPATIDITQAKLPAVYEQAKIALASCDKIDECQTWASKAEALASYARMAEDDSLRVMVDRIQARAGRRMGELLQQFDAQGQRTDQLSEGDHTKLSQKEAAEQAGLSKHQQVQAVRVANVPEEKFEAAIEAPKPATVTKLAEMGKQTRVDTKGRLQPTNKLKSAPAPAPAEAQARKAEVVNTASSEGKRLDPVELDNMARAICVGLNGLAPIVDRIHDIGVEKFLRQIRLSARSELFAVLDGSGLMDIHSLALNLRLKGKLDFGDRHDDDDAVTASESESPVAAPRAPETPATEEEACADDEDDADTQPPAPETKPAATGEWPDLPTFLDRRPEAEAAGPATTT